MEIYHQWQLRNESDSNRTADHDVIERGLDLKNFFQSVEWDLMSVPAQKQYRKYAGNSVPSPLWVFGVRLKRRFLFYTINLIIPLVSHVFITMLVFYLPADSREKIALCINILLSSIVFFLMLEEIIPSSSIVVPLLGKYLIFTMMIVTSSVVITVVTYNVHFRSNATHVMPDSVRKIFLYWLPRLLMMKRPKIENAHDVELKHIKLRCLSCLSSERNHVVGDKSRQRSIPPGQDDAQDFTARKQARTADGARCRKHLQSDASFGDFDDDVSSAALRRFEGSREVFAAIQGAKYIANHLRLDDEFNRVRLEHLQYMYLYSKHRYQWNPSNSMLVFQTREDWKYVALVIDRCFLWIYTVVCVLGTIGIICQAPMLYDTRKPLQIEQDLIEFPVSGSGS